MSFFLSFSYFLKAIGFTSYLVLLTMFSFYRETQDIFPTQCDLG